MMPGGFARGAQSANQAAVGSALDHSAADASGDFANVIGALSLMSASQAPAAFEALSGQNYAGFSTSLVQSAQLFMNNFARHRSWLAREAGTGLPPGLEP